MASIRRFVLTELFDPQDYEEYANFMFDHKFEEKRGLFSFPWPVEGGFAYRVHEKDLAKSMNSNVICVSLSTVHTKPSVYKEKKTETEEEEEVGEEVKKVAEKVEGEEEEDLEPRTGLCGSPARIFEPVDKLVQDRAHVMAKNPILDEFWTMRLQNSAGNFVYPSQLFAASNKDDFGIKSSQDFCESFGGYSAHNLFDILLARTDDSYCSTRYAFDPGIPYRSLFSTDYAMDNWVLNDTSETNHAAYLLVAQVVDELSRLSSTPLAAECYPFDPGIHVECDMLVPISLYFKGIMFKEIVGTSMDSLDFGYAEYKYDCCYLQHLKAITIYRVMMFWWRTLFKGCGIVTYRVIIWKNVRQIFGFQFLVAAVALQVNLCINGLLHYCIVLQGKDSLQIALGHCSLLEARGLAFSPVLLKLFRPSVEQALNANLKRIEESTAALAAADDWTLTLSSVGSRQSGRYLGTTTISTTLQQKITSSAHRFNLMVQDFFEDVGPLLSMQLGGQTLEGLFQVFNSYVSMLIKALPDSMEEEGNYEGSGNKVVRMAETEAQQIALLANASLLADELLPRAAMKLSPVNQAIYKDDLRNRPSDRQNRHPEQREWRRRLVNSVDRLKDTFCRQHALGLIFTEEGDSHLTADMYLNMDGNVEDIDWFPSPMFQELYVKLNRMAAIAADMFIGRERFATLLLMRLTESVILWISEDQSFWEDIVDGPKPLGSAGLHQFYLDMKFVICFASNGRYLSRTLHRVVNEIISKAMETFAATGMDPNSVLPEDDWFNETCQEAIERLSGKPKAVNGDRDLNSPTASISAQSVSSVRSS